MPNNKSFINLLNKKGFPSPQQSPSFKKIYRQKYKHIVGKDPKRDIEYIPNTFISKDSKDSKDFKKVTSSFGTANNNPLVCFDLDYENCNGKIGKCKLEKNKNSFKLIGRKNHKNHWNNFDSIKDNFKKQCNLLSPSSNNDVKKISKKQFNEFYARNMKMLKKRNDKIEEANYSKKSQKMQSKQNKNISKDIKNKQRLEFKKVENSFSNLKKLEGFFQIKNNLTPSRWRSNLNDILINTPNKNMKKSQMRHPDNGSKQHISSILHSKCKSPTKYFYCKDGIDQKITNKNNNKIPQLKYLSFINNKFSETIDHCQKNNSNKSIKKIRNKSFVSPEKIKVIDWEFANKKD